MCKPIGATVKLGIGDNIVAENRAPEHLVFRVRSRATV